MQIQGLNNVTKTQKIKRVGATEPIQLPAPAAVHCGVDCRTSPPARIKGRRPRLADRAHNPAYGQTQERSICAPPN
jgi:hypothetical protein